MEAAPIAGWEGGGRVSTPSLLPPPLFLFFPLPLSLALSSRLPPLRLRQRGRSHSSGRRRRRKKPAPPPLCLPSPLPGCRGWLRALAPGREGAARLRSRGLTGYAGRGKRGRKTSAAARARRGLPLRLCEGGEGSEEVGSREGRGRPVSDHSEKKRGSKIKIIKKKKKLRRGKAGDSPRGGLNGREEEGVLGAPRRGGVGGWGGPAQAARGPSAGSLLPLPGARRRPDCGRSRGVCGGAGRSGGERGERKKSGKRRRKGERERGERGNGQAGAGWGWGGLGSSLLSPSPGRAPDSLCAALPLARPVRLGLSLSLPPSVAHTQTKWRLLFLHSPESSEGSERRRRRPEMSQEKGGRGQPRGRGPAALAHTMERGRLACRGAGRGGGGTGKRNRPASVTRPRSPNQRWPVAGLFRKLRWLRPLKAKGF